MPIFLSFNRMREWRDIHAQLKELVTELGWRISETPAAYPQVHRALLAGLLGNIGTKTEEGKLSGRARYSLLGSSRLRRGKEGRALDHGGGVDRDYPPLRALRRRDRARMAGDGRCASRQGPPLRASLGKQPARVAAFERATLYGLLLYAKRRVHYGPTDPQESRKIFIRQALVEGDYDSRAPFFRPQPPAGA